MYEDDAVLNNAVRQWLREHPLQDGTSPDVHVVPESLFELAESDERLQQLNQLIKSLPAPQQRLLRYLSMDIEPALIIESMEYSSPELFWLDKALLVKEVDPTARQQDVIRVFEVNESLVALIIRISDLMEEEDVKARNRRFRKGTLIAAPLVLALLYFVVYPMLFRPDPIALFDKYIGRYTTDTTDMDSLSFAGATYLEASALLEAGRYAESAGLFQQVIQADTLLQTDARWYLALCELRTGNTKGCAEQLRLLRSGDPVFFRRVGGNDLLSKISR